MVQHLAGALLVFLAGSVLLAAQAGATPVCEAPGPLEYQVIAERQVGSEVDLFLRVEPQLLSAPPGAEGGPLPRSPGPGPGRPGRPGDLPVQR